MQEEIQKTEQLLKKVASQKRKIEELCTIFKLLMINEFFMMRDTVNEHYQRGGFGRVEGDLRSKTSSGKCRGGEFRLHYHLI